MKATYSEDSTEDPPGAWLNIAVVVFLCPLVELFAPDPLVPCAPKLLPTLRFYNF